MKKSAGEEDNAALLSIAKKLDKLKIKVATVVAQCENIDRNRDGIIHVSDLESILQSLMGRDSISMREFRHLANALGVSKSDRRGEVSYNALHMVLDPFTPKHVRQASVEKWYDPEEQEDESWPTQKGSVGEWLKKAACPAEVQNFKRFIACLEDFERSTGMKCVPKEDGFTVPLGPDLRASLSFYMA